MTFDCNFYALFHLTRGSLSKFPFKSVLQVVTTPLVDFGQILILFYIIAHQRDGSFIHLSIFCAALWGVYEVVRVYEGCITDLIYGRATPRLSLVQASGQGQRKITCILRSQSHYTLAYMFIFDVYNKNRRRTFRNHS